MSAPAGERRTALAAVVVIFLFALGFALSVNLPSIYHGFLFADQAVYYSMTQSIAFDRDLEFTRKDLARYYPDFDAGPQGIFLKKGRDGRIFFAKSFVYPLFAAPFVRLFGPNGFLVFHSILLLLVLLMGVKYFSWSGPPLNGLLLVGTFLFASAAAVYFIWMTPEFFDLAVVFAVLFLWLYKQRARAGPAEGMSAPAPTGRLERVLRSEGTDLAAAFLAGVAIYSKPPNAALLGPLLLVALARRKVLKAGGMVLAFLLCVGLLFSAKSLLSSDWSDWNYQGGERKAFYYEFPFADKGQTFDTVGSPMTSEDYFSRFLLPPKYIAVNIFYYLCGRFTGLAWYFFPALLLLFLFFRGRRDLARWLLLAAAAAEILAYIILMPTNYGGGGGSIANRYFLNIYPLFLFLPDLRIRKRVLVLPWLVAGLFLSQLLLNPFRCSSYPDTHAKRFPLKLLPAELTLINEWPTNTNPNGFRKEIGTRPNEGYLYFLDDNFNKQLEPTGFWTLWNRDCEMVLKTGKPLKEIVIRLLNSPRLENEVRVKVEGRTQRVKLGAKQWGTLRFPVDDGFWWRKPGKALSVYVPAGAGYWLKIPRAETHLYRIRIKAAKGSIPHYEDWDSLERRVLGVFFEMELIPRT
jgi:hypothetical protein